MDIQVLSKSKQLAKSIDDTANAIKKMFLLMDKNKYNVGAIKATFVTPETVTIGKETYNATWGTQVTYSEGGEVWVQKTSNNAVVIIGQ